MFVKNYYWFMYIFAILKFLAEYDYGYIYIYCLKSECYHMWYYYALAISCSIKCNLRNLKCISSLVVAL
jgi:hypothetical protein